MPKISELINEQIITALKGSIIISPRFTDYRVADVLNLENPDIEAEIKKMLKDLRKTEKKDFQGVDPKTKKTIDESKQKLSILEKGNVGDIQKLSTEQFGNIKSLAVDPFGFVSRTILRKLRTGFGVAFIVTIAIEVAKFMIQELFKPGRPFDIRFRELISKQIIQFMERKEQQELRQGFKSIITTTIGGLRGDSLRNQIGGNFHAPDRIRPNFIDPSYVQVRNTPQDARKRSFQDVGAAAGRTSRGN